MSSFAKGHARQCRPPQDVQSFGHDYDETLIEWHRRFEAAWPRRSEEYGGERFRRMWNF